MNTICLPKIVLYLGMTSFGLSLWGWFISKWSIFFWSAGAAVLLMIISIILIYKTCK
jgi:hypothetical protein